MLDNWLAFIVAKPQLVGLFVDCELPFVPGKKLVE
jgi:hypothetical protein